MFDGHWKWQCPLRQFEQDAALSCLRSAPFPLFGSGWHTSKWLCNVLPRENVKYGPRKSSKQMMMSSASTLWQLLMSAISGVRPFWNEKQPLHEEYLDRFYPNPKLSLHTHVSCFPHLNGVEFSHLWFSQSSVHIRKVKEFCWLD